MSTATCTQPGRPPLSSDEMGNAPAEAAKRELHALRAALEARLEALEAALANPNYGGSLETLVLDLAHVATEEAQAAADCAVRDAQAHAAVSATGVDLAEARAALDAEREGGRALRREVDLAQAALESEREARRGIGRDLTEARAALDAEREGGRALRSELQRAQEALAAERAAGDLLRRDGADAQATLLAERAESDLLRRKIDEAAQRITMAATARQAEVRNLREQFAAQLAQERATSLRLGETLARLQAELAFARNDIDARAADAVRAQARVDALEEERLDIERARDRLGARAEALSRDRDALARELEAAREGHSATRAETTIRLEGLEAERTNLERKVQEVEERLAEAAGACEAMAAELDAARGSARQAEAQLQVRDQQMREAEDRMRVLEIEAMQRDFEPQESDVELSRLLETARGGPAASSDDTAARRGSPDAASSRDVPPPEATLYPGPPARGASRHAFQEEIDVQIDRGFAQLVDLSTSGAQLLSLAPLRPNRAVRVLLPFDDDPIACKGKIVWARLESSRGGSLQYRAGVCFTSVDQGAVEAFLARHTDGAGRVDKTPSSH